MKLKHKQSILVLTTLFLFVLNSCKEKKETQALETAIELEKNYVEVITNGMDFEMVDEIKSGWTTFKYINKSYEPHFFILEKMPDTLGLKTYKKDLFPPFTSAFEHFEKGEIEAGMKEFEKIPEWFYKVELAGGVGLTSKKTTSKSTIFLEPGTYVMECYVRMPNGMPHTFMGMVKELKVNEETNDNKTPEADYNIDIASENGITFVDSLKTGNYILSVKFQDQKQYEHMMGHDVNLVKIENDSLISTLGNWLNTVDFKAFRSPAPENLLFLGGIEDLPAGKTGYFEVNLEKGSYVLISEIPNAVERKMIKTFSVY
jgi:plastocyanin